MEYEVVALASLETPAQDIDQKINRTLAVWRRDWLTPEQSKLLQDVFKALAAYVRGDLENFSKHGAAAGYWYGFAAATTEGDLDKALAAIDTMEDPTPITFALAYLLAEKAGDTARSDELLEKAVEGLKEGTPFQQHAAACLAGERECPLQEMDVTSAEVADAAILLTVLGVRFPEHRQEFFARARLLNFDPRFPHRFLAEILGDPPAEEAPSGSGSTPEAPEPGPESAAAETQ